jgi:hypothetical protein
MAVCSKNNENQDLLRRLGGADLLVCMLQAEVTSFAAEVEQRPMEATRVVRPESATLSAYIVGSLACLAEGNVHNQRMLDEAGIVPLLIRTLGIWLQSPHVVTNTCVALAHIAHRHEAIQHTVRMCGGTAAVLNALMAYRGYTAVQAGVCRAVAVLTESNHQNQQAFLATSLPDGRGKVGAIALLLHAIAEDEEALVTTACWALGNLITGVVTALDDVRLLGGLATIVSLLKRFEREGRACEYVCRLLAELALGNSAAALHNRSQLRSLGACEAVAVVVKQHAKSQGFVLDRARDALQNIQAHPSQISRVC